MDRSTLVSYSCSLETSYPALTVPKILALLKVAKRTQNGNQQYRWRHLAVVTRPVDRLTRNCYRCSFDIFRPALIVFELLALSGCEKGPEAETSGKWRHPATLTSPFDRPTSVHLCVFREQSSSSSYRLKLLALFHSAKTDRKWKSFGSGAT
jgi:hypothetical protein